MTVLAPSDRRGLKLASSGLEGPGAHAASTGNTQIDKQHENVLLIASGYEGGWWLASERLRNGQSDARRCLNPRDGDRAGGATELSITGARRGARRTSGGFGTSNGEGLGISCPGVIRLACPRSSLAGGGCQVYAATSAAAEIKPMVIRQSNRIVTLSSSGARSYPTSLHRQPCWPRTAPLVQGAACHFLRCTEKSKSLGQEPHGQSNSRTPSPSPPDQS